MRSLRKIPQFHLISWSVNFAERHSFRRVSDESPKTLRKLCLSAKFTDQQIRWNYGIFRSEFLQKGAKKELVPMQKSAKKELVPRQNLYLFKLKFIWLWDYLLIRASELSTNHFYSKTERMALLYQVLHFTLEGS